MENLPSNSENEPAGRKQGRVRAFFDRRAARYDAGVEQAHTTPDNQFLVPNAPGDMSGNGAPLFIDKPSATPLAESPAPATADTDETPPGPYLPSEEGLRHMNGYTDNRDERIKAIDEKMDQGVLQSPNLTSETLNVILENAHNQRLTPKR